MKIRIMSDLHLEMEVYMNGERYNKGAYKYFSIPVTADEGETVLILAGDVGRPDEPITIVPFIEEMCSRFKEVLYVPGNHEYYGLSFITGLDVLKGLLAHTSCYVLNNDTIKIDGVSFIGATMWTDYDKGNILSMMRAKMAINDYATIKTGTLSLPKMRPLDPVDLVGAHLNSRHYVDTALNDAKYLDNSKAVVITHHLPSFKSVHPMFHGNDCNGAYYSELGDLIADYSPSIWCHGHTHCSCDYVFFQTRVICNPRGYRPRQLNCQFDPSFTVEI